MDLFVGQRVALVHEADRDMAKKALLVCLTDLARHQDLTLAPAQIMEQLERYHLASDDYEELMDAILEHPSPEKTLDGDPYIKYRALYHRRQKTATTSTSLPSSVTGDTGQMHTDNQALSGPALSIDFIPLEPGVMCSYCGHNQAECTVNQATLCLDCAENRWGIPVQEAMNDPGTPGDAPQEPSAAETSAAMELDPRTVDAIEKTGAAYTGDHVFKFRPFEGDEWEEGEHKLEAWPKEHAHWADTEDANDRPAEAQPDGAITWHNQTGAIQYLGVRPHAQRQGLASELYHRAGQAADEHGVIFPEHSQERTVQGDAWARSLHQHLPENQLSEEHEPPHIAGLVDWLLGKVKPLAPGAPRFEHSWCRFRSADRCWKSGVLDNMATQQMGYAVWQPRDMGPCGRATKAAQKACGHSDWGPGSEPGPGSNDPQSLTDATTAFSEGGQRNGTPGPVYRYAAMEYKPAHLQTPEEFANHPSTFWHGTPNGEIGKVVAAYGIHVGTHEAAKQALEARIGRRADGKDWDGTQEYGKTLLDQGEHRHHFNPQDRTWTEHVEHHEPVYPTEGASYSSGPRMSLTDKPNIVPLRITGPMTNTPQTPHEDFKANGYMRAQLTKGNAKSGYYYRNVGEDDSSISAVVPSRAHVKTHEDFKREAGVLHQASNDDHSRSAMVSLDLPPGLVDSTEDPPHCTVVYLGKDLEGPRVEEIAARLQELAAGTPGPLTGTVGGLGTFPPSASSDWKTPVYAIPQIEGINELRSHLEDLNASEHKEFSPHVTLKYAEPWDPMPIASDPTPVSFDHLTLHNGDDVRHFPFAGKLGALHTLKERRPLLTHPDYYKAPDYEGTHFLTVDQARAAAPKVCPCGQKITWDPIDGPQHEDGSVTHEDGDSVSDKVFHRSPEEIRDRRTAIGDAWLEQMKREGSWNDVVQKAKRLRETNAVHILEVPTPQSPYVFAEVKGDTAVHHCFVAVKGGEQGQWSCSCPWGDYGPNGPLAEDRKVERYKKTPCSHVLATRWELQSRSMFGRNPYTGALHEAMAMVDPEMWRQPKPQWDLDEHKRYTDAGDDDKASQQHHEYYTRKKHWEHSMDSALSMGHITPDEAVARGHRPANYDQDKEYGRDSGYQPQGWQEMPHTMYHVTTNAPAVREHGLKTRHELDQGLGAGLGGGEDSTISFTDNEDIAHDIHRGIHEMRQVARGERTVHHMIDEARTGKDAKRPFLNDLTRQLGQGEVGHRELDRLTRGVTRNRNSANPMRPKEPGDWAPAPDAHVWKHGTTGETLASRWERPSTEDEKREDAMQFAKSFSAHREHAGGPSDPLFFTADTKGLANIPAHHIQILKVHPRPGARGYPMSGMKEWRTSAGGAVDVEPEPVTPRHQIEREASVDPLETWFEGRFLVEARGPQDHSNLENYMAPHRHPAGEEWSTKNMSGTYPSNPRATHFEDLPDHDQTEVAGKVHKALSEAPTIPNTSAGGARNPMPAKPYDAPQTHDDISHNIEDMFHSARISDENEGTSYLKSGREWYGQAHKQVHKWAKQYGIDPHRMAAATACLSPSTDWDSNLTMAHYYVHHLGKTGQINNESFHMNKDHPDYQKDKDKAAEHNVDLDGLEGKRFEDMTDMEAHHAVKHQAMRVDKVTKAYGGDMVEESDKGTSWQGGKFGARAAGIIRGTSDPDKALSGHKVRSFYNNIYHPGKTDDVTVDSHATSLAVGAKMGAESKTLGKVLEFGGSDRERKHNSLGGYSYMASAYRKAHSNLVASGHMDAKSTPADLQAITWKRWRDLMPAAVAGKKGHTPSLYTPKDAYPVLASLQDDDDDGPPVDESPEHYLDPMGGPDEPDPDLHAREEPDWEDAPEDDEDDEEDDDGLLKVGAMYDWTEMLRSARRERLAEQVVAPYQPPQVPVQYLTQQPHHLSSGYDEWGFEAPAVHQAGAVPSAQWQEEHSSEARNPGDTAPHDFGAPLDPNFRPSMLDRPYSDEKLLEPGGVATGGPFRSHMPAGYEVMTGSVHYPGEPGPPGQYPQVPTPVSRVAQVAPLPIPAGMSPEGASILAEHQAGLDYLRPPEGSPSGPPGASVGTGPVSREAALAQDQADKAQFASAAEQFLQTGSIAAPGMMINMDNIFSLPQGVIQREARSRDFTPSEQEEMVKEGELEGVRASNYGMLRLDGSMYEELERQLQVDEQSQSSAYDLFGG